MDNLRELIKEAIQKHANKSLILHGKPEISEALQYHIDNGLSLCENMFRVYSESYFDLVNEVRDLWKEGKIDLNEDDTDMVESDLGKRAKVNGKLVYLDAPFVYETEEEQDILDEAKNLSLIHI